MTDNQNPNPNPPQNLPHPQSNSWILGEIGCNGSTTYGGHKPHYPNPPDAMNPATLREQWGLAIRRYSRWYSQAWSTAILVGLSLFALGWIIKGSNRLPSFVKHEDEPNRQQHDHNTTTPPVPPPLTSSPSDAHQTPKS